MSTLKAVNTFKALKIIENRWTTVEFSTWLLKTRNGTEQMNYLIKFHPPFFTCHLTQKLLICRAHCCSNLLPCTCQAYEWALTKPVNGDISFARRLRWKPVGALFRCACSSAKCVFLPGVFCNGGAGGWGTWWVFKDYQARWKIIDWAGGEW